ncbi:MAG: 30S ribosomal protein S8e [Candidatus Woesearchaeota archaeon]
MAILKLRSNRKATGGRYKKPKVKRMARFGRLSTNPKIGETKSKTIKTIGGNVKNKLLMANKANVYDAKTKTYEVLDIKTAVENKANVQFVRRNILTKGTVIETAKGKAKITSRPGQNTVVNAVLVE